MNRRKAKYKHRKLHLKITNQREDFLHKLSRRLSSTYEKISMENLNIKKMLQNHKYAKSISDAAWNKLFQFTSYKAITGGGEVKWKEPRNTSKTCRICGTIIDMKISDRIFLCPNCSHCEDRDVNAAHNILNKVGTDCAELNACGDTTSISALKCVGTSNIVEARTISNRGFQFQ
jgi:putative transposase